MTSPVTLGDLVRDGKLVWVYCTACGHERDIDPATMPLPRETPVPEVGKRMKCSACGSRKIDARPELYPGGVVAMREREGRHHDPHGHDRAQSRGVDNLANSRKVDFVLNRARSSTET